MGASTPENIFATIDELHELIANIDSSRERALALTKLDECRMWYVESLNKAPEQK